MLVEIVGAGGDERRHREEERELGRRFPGQAEQHGADDRRAGARRAGDQRKALRETHLERIVPGHVVDALDPRAPRAPLDPQDHECAGDERGRHRHRPEEMRLDQAPEQQAKDRRRDEGYHQVRDEPLRGAVRGEPREHREKLRAVLPHDREHRAGLDREIERLRLLAVEAEQIGGEDQVAGARDRQELGEAFDDAEDERLEEERDIHAAGILPAGAATIGE